MDPVRLIKQDHRTIKALFRKFGNSGKAGGRQKVAEAIIGELTVHMAIEEQLVYPALRAREKRLEGAVLNAFEEHHAVKLALLELDKMRVEDERFAAKMHFVQEVVSLHIKEEEAQLLPRLERFDAKERQVLAEAMAKMKREAPRHPQPSAVDIVRGSAIVSVITRLNDTGKDVIGRGKDMLRKFANGQKGNGRRGVKSRASAAAAAIAKRARRSEGKGRSAAVH